MSSTGTLRLPRTIHFGYGVRAQLPQILLEHGRRVLAVVDPFLLQSPRLGALLAEVENAGAVVEISSDVLPELPVESLGRAADAARTFDPDVVLAFGGGSAIDAAKLIALLIRYGGSLSDYYGENVVPGPIIPVIAVPTTSGTGSEVTPVAVVSDPAQEMKVGISSPFLIPAAAVVDPEFTLGAPSTVIAYAGIDALVHALESFTAARLDIDWAGRLPVFMGQNVFAETLALQSVAHLSRNLPALVADVADRDAGEKVALGSLLAGMSFGPTGTHLSHAIQYPIGALTKTPHGLGTGLMIPYVLQALVAVAPERLAALAPALGVDGAGDERAAAQEVVESVDAVTRAIGIPRSLAEIGVEERHLPRIVELAMRSQRLVAISPIRADEAVIRAIVQAAHSGDRAALASETARR